MQLRITAIEFMPQLLKRMHTYITDLRSYYYMTTHTHSHSHSSLVAHSESAETAAADVGTIPIYYLNLSHIIWIGLIQHILQQYAHMVTAYENNENILKNEEKLNIKRLESAYESMNEAIQEKEKSVNEVQELKKKIEWLTQTQLSDTSDTAVSDTTTAAATGSVDITSMTSNSGSSSSSYRLYEPTTLSTTIPPTPSSVTATTASTATAASIISEKVTKKQKVLLLLWKGPHRGGTRILNTIKCILTGTFQRLLKLFLFWKK